MIHINREIFLELTPKLQKEYISSTVLTFLIEKDISEDFWLLTYLSDGIFEIISKNEKCLSKYGMEKYLDETYPAKDHVSGYYYSTGKYVICPFDWTPDKDGNFNYSFTVAKTM